MLYTILCAIIYACTVCIDVQNELLVKFRDEMKEKSALEELKASNATYIDKLQQALSEKEKQALSAQDTIRNLQNVFFALQDSNVRATNHFVYLLLHISTSL